MKLGFIGMTHLGQTLKKASEIRGFDAVEASSNPDIMFVTRDVEDHDDLGQVTSNMERAIRCAIGWYPYIPIVLVSQIPPGFTRPWTKNRGNIFYQVDTIIMNRALERATMPERFIIGCQDCEEDLPAPYAEYLAAFNCPIIKMSYESAELSKLAINYYLAKQIETTNALAAVARHVGANWDEMIPGLRLDARIGAHAYIRPGEVGGHLPRDVRTIERLIKEAAINAE
jgi:UDPglucose 6-dehydrogenase